MTKNPSSSEGDEASFHPHSPELGPWRLAAPKWLRWPPGSELDSLRMAYQVSSFRDGSSEVSFPTPSAAALHLNAAWKSALRALQLKTSIAWIVEGSSKNLDVRNTDILFDYLEEMMITAYCSYAAIEAYCNWTIVSLAKGPIEVKRKKETLQLKALEAERNVSTAEKLKRIVPDILGVPTPAGKRVWELFRDVEGLRDRVTHFKRRDQLRPAHETSEPTALFELYQTDPMWLPQAAMEIIRYFYRDKRDEPRWLQNPAWTVTEAPAGGR